MLKHLEFVRRTHKDVELLSKKEVKYLQDKLANSDGSDYEPKQYNEVFGPTKRKIHNQRRRRTLGMIMVSRKSTGFAKNILIHWERELLRFKGALKKLKKTLSFEYPYIINPDGSPKLLWDLLCLSIVIYSIISIPLEMSFDVVVSDEFDITITVIFFFDIFLNFNTGVYQNGTLRMDRRIILKDYFKVWFWVDSISTIPYDEIIDSSAGYAKSARLLSLVKFLKFVKILRLLRLAKLKIMFDKLDQLLQVNKSMAIALTFFKLFLFVIFFAHILGCGFHFLGSNELEQGSWLQPYWDQPWYIRYIESLYWGVTTMVTVGYGDISPQSPAERTLGVFLLLLACGGFAFTMNSIGTALKQIGEKSEITKQRMSGVNRYMKQAKIADGLQNRIRKYLEYVWDSNKTMTINDLTSTLSGDLSSKIRQQVNGKMLSYVDLFWTHFTKQFLLELVPLVNENLYCPQELIINEDQFDYDLFIIQNGEVEIFYLKTDVVMDKKIKGDYFGEVSFFSDKPRSASARSHDFSNIFVVKQKIFIELCRKYPNDCERYFYLRHKIVFQNDYSCINIRCYTCQMDDHVARYCPSLHFTVVAHHFLEFQKQASRLTQSIFVRKDRIDYHAWLHNQTILQCQIRHKNHFVKKTQYIESSRKFRINDDDEHVSEEDINNDDYAVLNQMNKLSINSKKFKPKKTVINRQQSGLINNSMLSEEDLLIEKIAMQRIQQYVAEFQRRKSFKYYWVEFSDLPGLDKQQEYEIFFPKHNFSKQVKTYEKWIEFKDEQQNDNEIFNKHEFGVEELKVYSQYYGHQIDYFDLDKQLSKSHHADHISYDQKRILRLDRRTKKKYKHIPEPTKVFNKSFIVLKAIKHFKRASVNKSELNIINVI